LKVFDVSALVFDVAFYDGPVAAGANSRDIVAIAPEFTTPELFLQIGKLKEKLSGCDAFDEMDDLADAVFGMKAY